MTSHTKTKTWLFLLCIVSIQAQPGSDWPVVVEYANELACSAGSAWLVKYIKPETCIDGVERGCFNGTYIKTNGCNNNNIKTVVTNTPTNCESNDGDFLFQEACTGTSLPGDRHVLAGAAERFQIILNLHGTESACTPDSFTMYLAIAQGVCREIAKSSNYAQYIVTEDGMHAFTYNASGCSGVNQISSDFYPVKECFFLLEFQSFASIARLGDGKDDGDSGSGDGEEPLGFKMVYEVPQPATWDWTISLTYTELSGCDENHFAQAFVHKPNGCIPFSRDSALGLVSGRLTITTIYNAKERVLQQTIKYRHLMHVISEVLIINGNKILVHFFFLLTKALL
eukprot:m.219661 g.219661  ORF g.219661 m.219661 type:complete len:340 (-) comp15916_c1_seq3:616-1635(-)